MIFTLETFFNIRSGKQVVIQPLNIAAQDFFDDHLADRRLDVIADMVFVIGTRVRFNADFFTI